MYPKMLKSVSNNPFFNKVILSFCTVAVYPRRTLLLVIIRNALIKSALPWNTYQLFPSPNK